MQFEWDPNKAESNFEKHGILFSEATTIFSDPLELTITDPDHSMGEYRFLSIGRSVFGRLLAVSYSEKENNSIRVIGARPATKSEQKLYEHN